MKKRVIAIVSALGLMLSLSACGSKAKKAVTISNASLSEGVYAYYLDYALSNKKQVGLEESCTDKQATEKAKELCVSHIAVSSLCHENGYELSNIEKDDVAKSTDNYWGMFGDYYESMGISKQDLLLVTENAAKRELLIDSYFGEKGKAPVKKKELVSALNKGYVGFKAITGYLTPISDDGSTKLTYTKKELDKINSDFNSFVKKLNKGADIDELNRRYNKSQGITGNDSLSVIIIDSNDATYADGFFQQCASVPVGTATLFKTPDYIYAVQRVDISSEEYLSQYKNSIIEAIRSDDIAKMISDWSAAHDKVKFSGSLNKIGNAVLSEHKS